MAEEAEVASQLAAIASGDGETEEAPDPETDEESATEDGEEERPSIMEVLFSTEPNLKPSSVAEDQGVEIYEAHGYVALRKMANGMGFDLGDAGSGTPAIYNLVQFGRGALEAQSDQEADTGDDVQGETPDVAQEFA